MGFVIGIYHQLGSLKLCIYWILTKGSHILDSQSDLGVSLLMLKQLRQQGYSAGGLALLVTAASIDLLLTTLTLAAPDQEAEWLLQVIVTVLVCEVTVLVTTTITWRRSSFRL